MLDFMSFTESCYIRPTEDLGLGLRVFIFGLQVLPMIISLVLSCAWGKGQVKGNSTSIWGSRLTAVGREWERVVQVSNPSFRAGQAH